VVLPLLATEVAYPTRSPIVLAVLAEDVVDLINEIQGKTFIFLFTSLTIQG
jgi:hypothetical protein